MARRVFLVFLDAVAMAVSGIFAGWIVMGGTSRIPMLHFAIMVVASIAALFFVKFYRIRIASSSVEVITMSLEGLVPVGLVAFIYEGLAFGFNSLQTRWVIVFFIVSFCAVLGMRILYRMLGYNSHLAASKNPSAIIYGAGELGCAMARMCLKGKFNYKILGFLDDDSGLQGGMVVGFPILGNSSDVEKVLRQYDVDTLVIAITHIGASKIQTMVDASRKYGVGVKIVPNLFESKGRSSVSVRDINYEDLLGRSLITIEKEPVEEMFHGKTVLVTGAGGSIGSEISRQLMGYNLKKLVLLDIDETELHDLCLRLLDYRQEWSNDVVPVVCDIKNAAKMERMMSKYKPDIILHAAAYKHVPLMELYPEEAILNNVCGSYNVFKAAKDCGVGKVIVISTDKAVNPTNIMGATKRVVEMMACAMTDDRTEFCCVRFGNVIGSRGSMLPLFLEEIKEGKPITVTDKRIIRYFMAIPEAVSLVFRAATLAHGGEVMVLDMGEPVKIYDFAEKLIDVFGDGRSSIVVTGLRPGEKLYEELLADKDNTIPTTNQKIFKAKVLHNPKYTHDYLAQMVNDLPGLSPEELVARLHAAVPEFVSPKQTKTS